MNDFYSDGNNCVIKEDLIENTKDLKEIEKKIINLLDQKEPSLDLSVEREIDNKVEVNLQNNYFNKIIKISIAEIFQKRIF